MGLEDINSRGVFNNMDILHYRYPFSRQYCISP